MAMFGTKKAKPSEGSELVLAYLEDAQRVRASLIAIDPKGREVPASLVAVTEERVTFATQGRVMAEKGDSVGIIFYLDGLRLRTKGRVQEVKTGTMLLELPASIELAERRRKPRARMNQREGATAIALTGLFDGIGLTGTIDNISETGLCLKVGRAMNVKTQGPMHLGPNLVSAGDVLMLIKLSKLPKCPLLELAGTVTHVASEGGLLSVGIAFEAGKEALLGPVKSLVASRAGTIPATIPPKVRRPQEPKPDPAEPPLELTVPRPVPAKVPEPPATPSAAPASVAPEPIAASESAPLPSLPTSSALEPPETASRGSALLRVKKRSRCLLLAMPEGPDREALAAFLANDGYGRVRTAATLTELLTYLEEVHLVFVDGGVAELQGLALASLVRQRLEDGATPVLLAEASVDAELVLGARETGVAQVLVKPYDLDEDFLCMIEGHLGFA